MRHVETKKGFYLVEIIVASAIVAIVVVALFTAFTLYLNVALTNTEKIQATYLAEEGIEALRTVRDGAWSSLSSLTPGSTYYIAFNGSLWQTSDTPVTYVDGVFERTFTVESVLRDAVTKDIGVSGVEDVDTRKIIVTVNWQGIRKATSTISIGTYFTNIHQ